MMCQRIGSGPISTIGFGRISVSSASRVPIPPARMPTFTTPSQASHRPQHCPIGKRTGGTPEAPPFAHASQVLVTSLIRRPLSVFGFPRLFEPVREVATYQVAELEYVATIICDDLSPHCGID